MKRASKIIFGLLFALSIIFIGVPRVKADVSTSYSTGLRYHYNENLHESAGYEYLITESIRLICESIVEPQGFEQRGGGTLEAYIPLNYIIKNPNNNQYYLFDNVYFNIEKIYANNTYRYEDIIILFGKSNDFVNGMYSIRFNGVADDCTAITLAIDIYVPRLQPLECFYYLTEYGYIDSYTTADYINLVGLANVSESNIFEDTQAYNSGVASVLARPQDYQLYTYDQLQSASDLAYQNGLNASSTDLSDYSNLVSTTFQGFTSILNTQVFPHITIGLIIGLPILLGLFLIIIKLIRG